MEDLNAAEVLVLLETSEKRNVADPHRLLVNAMVFVLITLFCVGG